MNPHRLRWIKAVSLRGFVFAVVAAVIFGTAAARTSLAHSNRLSPLALTGSLSATEASVQARDRVVYFEHRLARNPNDIDILNRLSVFYLQRLRETGAFSDLDLAMRASQQSLRIVPPIRNLGGLTSRAMAEFASHEFAAARTDALLMARLDSTATPYALIGDVEAELGNYGAASAAYAHLQRTVGMDENVATRRARMAVLHGDNEAAEADFAQALTMEAGRTTPSRELVAWYAWQLGDTAFFTGDYTQARSRYSDALAVYPGYFKALASLGRLDAATGNTTRAIADYQGAIDQLPDPTFVAELGDVYTAIGDRESAEREYALVDAIGHLSVVNGVMYNRQLVMFDADHDRNSVEAFRLAKREYVARRDIFGADAVAWTALKAAYLPEAQRAMHAALRLGTQDPRLWYHAGMIERAAGNLPAARFYLTRALRLSPEFDVLQAVVARNAVAGLGGLSP